MSEHNNGYFSIQQIEEIAAKVLKLHPDPVPRNLLLTQVLRKDNQHHDISQTRQAMLESKWVTEVLAAQQENGTWGRFHSEDTKEKHKFRTTELALRRCKVLGLDHHHERIQKSIRYMEAVLQKQVEWSDRSEKPDSWLVAVEVITAATLSQFAPRHPLLAPVIEKWVEIARSSITPQGYSESGELAAQRRVHHIQSNFHYLLTKYSLQLLSCQPGLLSPELEEALVPWAWSKPDGIGYFKRIQLTQMPSGSAYPQVKTPLEVAELLSGFRSSKAVCEPFLQWLWERRYAQGLWDFGEKGGEIIEYPLSEDWRERQKRSIDYTTRILCILKRFVE